MGLNMKAVMSQKVREILKDPEKRKDLIEGLNKLHRSNKEKSNIKIGDNTYEMKFVNTWEEKSR